MRAEDRVIECEGSIDQSTDQTNVVAGALRCHTCHTCLLPLALAASIRMKATQQTTQHKKPHVGSASASVFGKAFREGIGSWRRSKLAKDDWCVRASSMRPQTLALSIERSSLLLFGSTPPRSIDRSMLLLLVLLPLARSSMQTLRRVAVRTCACVSIRSSLFVSLSTRTATKATGSDTPKAHR